MPSEAVAELAGDEESDTCTVKLDVPAVVGVPVIAPLVAFKLKPAGKVPVVIFQLYGAIPPVAVNVALYITPAVPPGSDVVVMETGAETGAVMVMLKVPVAVFELLSRTWTANDEVAAVVGVPEMVPLLLRLSPAGRLPEVTLQL